MSLRIAIVQGGPSSEAEVSRASAAAIAGALAASGHAVSRLELGAELPSELLAGRFDAVFPIAHGAVGEDGALQGLLEVLGVPYVGSEVLASALAMDKASARVAFAAAGLPVAAGLAVGRGDAPALDLARAVRARLGRAVVVKPATSGSAIGVTRIEPDTTDADLAAALEGAFALAERVVVERFVRGREITCGVLERDGAGRVALPPTEIRAPGHAFYTFEARYAAGGSEHVCPAPLAPALLAEVQRVAVAAHGALGCRDLSRADFVVGDADAGAPERVTLLEVNTLPGFTATSLYPEAAAVAGVPMAALVDGLVRRAAARGARARNAARRLPGGGATPAGGGSP